MDTDSSQAVQILKWVQGRIWIAGCYLLVVIGSSHAGVTSLPNFKLQNSDIVKFVVTCKSYSNCEQAVTNWCAGTHPRADGDGDGIPCENVCRSRRQVREIEREIGCDR